MEDEAIAGKEPPGLDRAGLAELLDRQEGVVARRQLHELGATSWDVRRLLRRRELTVVHPGVYINHPLRAFGPFPESGCTERPAWRTGSSGT